MVDADLSGRHLADLLDTATPEERAEHARWYASGGKGPLPVIVQRADALANDKPPPTVGVQRGLFGR